MFHFGRQYKIWFSPDRNQFLPLTNQLRLIRMVKDNPGIILSLVFSSQCLSDKSIIELHSFCERYSIIPVSFESLVVEAIDENDRKLADIVFKEIDFFNKKCGGNLGAASDCTRLMRIVIEHCGIYSDIDVHTSLSKLFEGLPPRDHWVSLRGPVLFHGVQSPLGLSNILMCNNDFLGFDLEESNTPLTLSKESSKCLADIQNELLSRYSFDQFTLQQFINRFCKHDVDAFWRKLPTLQPFIKTLYADSSQRTLFETRIYLETLHQSQLSHEIKCFVFSLLKNTVCSISGPSLYPWLFRDAAPKDQSPSLITPNTSEWFSFHDVFLRSSIGFYDEIYSHVDSGNEVFGVIQGMQSRKKTVGGDLSWTSSGLSRLKQEDITTINAAKRIHRFWKDPDYRAMLKENQTALNCIEAHDALKKPYHDKKYGLLLRRSVVGLKTEVIHFLLTALTKGQLSFNINEATSKGETALDLALNISDTSALKETKVSIITSLISSGAKTLSNTTTLDAVAMRFQPKM